ncbi:MAG TPA: transcriptional repressor [Chloroflexi bacterium]|nr:transcriptional repressor [Chloroflexota bacterium]
MALEEIIATLRARGYRITLPRRQTLQILLRAHSHLTCEQVHQRLVAQGLDVDEATTYRTLQWLKENGIIAQTDLGLGADVYSLIDSPLHHHLVCLRCGRISEISDSLFEPIRRQVRERYHFEPRIEHWAIFGICAECQSNEKGKIEPGNHGESGE